MRVGADQVESIAADQSISEQTPGAPYKKIVT